MTSRSTFASLVLASSLVIPLAGCADITTEEPGFAVPAQTLEPSPAEIAFEAGIGALEEKFDARVGVTVIYTGNGRPLEYRGDERFGYASTLKALAAAIILRDTTADERDEKLRWTAADVEASGYSPVTSEHIDDGLTVAELAEAAVRTSDNTALNLLLDYMGGAAELDIALDGIGDDTISVVNTEPALNTLTPGSDDDTTTPSAYANDLDSILGGDVLEQADIDTLLEWMGGNATGDALIRASAPEGWVVADKSGGAGGIRNDVAVVAAPGREPIIMVIFTERNDPDADYDDALVAGVAEVAFEAVK